MSTTEPTQPDEQQQDAEQPVETDAGGEKSTRPEEPGEQQQPVEQKKQDGPDMSKLAETRAALTEHKKATTPRKSTSKKKPAAKQNGAKSDGKASDDAVKKAKRELTTLNKKVREKGHTNADVKKARELAQAAGANVPSWVPKEQAQRAQARADDPDLRLAHEATALATGGHVTKDGHLEIGSVKFGANVTAVQIKAVHDAVKGKNILKQVLHGVSEAALVRYAKGEIKATDLPEDTKKALTELNKSFPPKMKMWARKDAAILVILHRDRKHHQRSHARPKQQQADKAAVAA